MRKSILLILVLLTVGGCKPKASFTITCSTQAATTVQCTAKNAGPQAALACWDVIVTCGGTECEAEKVCAKKLGPGESDTVVVNAASFHPAVKDLETCVDLHHDELSLE